ncbi:MAG: tRNA (adenosine(37)-N6)-threonylcarbamoyltransferase complex ATPase subunit type 1 TsaE [Patescibacteria group bacterium]|jgi:tRNA threonylcarbamoyladenosine biosynthesis protein TsaE|nr:tRNA (adenosine(37)-N6)-threonylcarbamoyltransferase complex ATPase subunit type 1 TsaE [Patescibacteria group bacterium]
MKSEQKYLSQKPEDTFVLGEKLATSLNGGEVVALYGNLGAGKTAFVQGLAFALGVKHKVNSPTFNIMKVYKTKHQKIKQLCHIDAYRLSGFQDLLDIGVQDYLEDENVVVVIEWADKIKEILPKNVIKVSIKSVNEFVRTINISL